MVTSIDICPTKTTEKSDETHTQDWKLETSERPANAEFSGPPQNKVWLEIKLSISRQNSVNRVTKYLQTWRVSSFYLVHLTFCSGKSELSSSFLFTDLSFRCSVSACGFFSEKNYIIKIFWSQGIIQYWCLKYKNGVSSILSESFRKNFGPDYQSFKF